MAQKLRTTRRNEFTISTGGSSDWRSIDNELTRHDAGEGTASTGQKLADGFEKDYAVDISSLLTPNPPRTFHHQSNVSVSADRAKNKRSNSRIEGVFSSVQGVKPSVIPKSHRESNSKIVKDTSSCGPKSERNPGISLHSLHPSQPISELNVTAELRKLWDEPESRPTAPPVSLDDSMSLHIRGTPSLDNGVRFYRAAEAPRVTSHSSAGHRGSGRFSSNRKHRGGLSDIPSKGFELRPSPPPSPSLSDVLYDDDDGMSSIINTATAVYPNIYYGSQRPSASKPTLPLSPAPSNDFNGDGTNCPDSPASSCNVSHKFNAQVWGHPYSGSRASPRSPAQLLETTITTLASIDDKKSSQGQRFMPRQRPPLRDLSSNGLRARNSLRKDAQIRSSSISSSQKENFHPHKESEYRYEHGTPSGRENIPRNRSDVSISFSDVIIEQNKASTNPSSDNNTGRLKRHSTRFSQNKMAGGKGFFSSADASLKVDLELQVTSSTVLHEPEASFASDTDTAAYRVDNNKLRRSSSRSSRFSRPLACSASAPSIQTVNEDPSLTVLVGLSSTNAVLDPTSIKMPDNLRNEDLASSVRLVFDRLQRLEKENQTLSQDIRRLNSENLALSDRVQALEAANSTTGARIGELSDENLSINTLLRALEKTKTAVEEQAQSIASDPLELQDGVINREQACPVVDDNFQVFAEENLLKQDQTEVSEARAVTSDRPDTEEISYTTAAAAPGEAPLDNTLLTLVDKSEVEELRRKLEAARRNRKCGDICHMPSDYHSISMPPLSQALADIGVGVEITEPDTSSWAEEDPSTLPQIKTRVLRGQ